MFLSLNWPAVRASEILGSMLVKFCAILSRHSSTACIDMDDGWCEVVDRAMYECTRCHMKVSLSDICTAICKPVDGKGQPLTERKRIWISLRKRVRLCCERQLPLASSSIAAWRASWWRCEKRRTRRGDLLNLCKQKKLEKEKTKKQKKRQMESQKERIRCGPQRSKKNWTGPV